MITILVIFVILIIIVALSKNYFIGTVKNDTLLFTDGIKSLNPDLISHNKSITLNNQVVKAQKIINRDLCILIDNKPLTYSPARWQKPAWFSVEIYRT